MPYKPTYEELEQRIKELENAADSKLINILDVIPDGVYMINQQFELEYANTAIIRDFGHVENRRCYKYFHGRKEICPWCNNAEIFDGKTIEREWYSADNNKHYKLFSAPIENRDGSISKIVVLHDITTRKRSEEELLKAQGIAHFGNWSWDITKDVITWSPEIYRIYGLNPDAPSLKYEEVMEFIHPDDLETHPLNIDQFLKNNSGQHFEYRICRPDGSIRHIHDLGEISYGVNGEPVRMFGFLQDITKCKQVEEELKKYRDSLEIQVMDKTETLLKKNEELREEISERKQAEREALILRAAIDQVPVGIALADENLNLYFCNPEGLGLRGGNKNELVKIPKKEFVNWQVLKLNGEPYEPDKLPLVRAVRNGLTIREELLVRHQDGSDHICDAIACPVYENGKIIGGIVVFLDISEQRQLEAKLHQSHKMESISTLAGGIAHQFNNALAVITGYIELLELDFFDNIKINNYTRKLKNSASHMTNLTAQLLAYAMGGKYHAKNISLTEFVEKTLPLLKHITGSNISVDTDLPQNIYELKADPTQLQMILSAILANASESISGTGNINISCRNVTITSNSSGFFPGLKPGKYAQLIITDNGKGMDEYTRRRVLEPFFTTNFEGRGLGMAAVYGIVKNHNGWIGINSKPNHGTKISLYFPAVEVPIEKSAEQATEISPGSGIVLLIEDEELVIKVGQMMIERLGYKVLTAKCGLEAIDITKTFNGNIDLALLDMELPDIKGHELYPQLVKLRPEMKIIVCSGHSFDGPARDIVDKGALAFLQKPFTLAELSQKLKKSVERRIHKRLQVQSGAFAKLKSAPSFLGQIVDISQGGLACSFPENSFKSSECSESEQISINVTETGFCLENLICRSIINSFTADDIYKKSRSTKRCYQFKDLAPTQMDQLACFIESHTVVN